MKSIVVSKQKFDFEDFGKSIASGINNFLQEYWQGHCFLEVLNFQNIQIF